MEQFFVTCRLEMILVDELRQLGAEHPRGWRRRAVRRRSSGLLPGQSRKPDRQPGALAGGEAGYRGENDIYWIAYAVPWTVKIDAARTIRVDVSQPRARLRVSTLSRGVRQNPPVVAAPAERRHARSGYSDLRALNPNATFSLDFDTSGEALFKRGHVSLTGGARCPRKSRRGNFCAWPAGLRVSRCLIHVRQRDDSRRSGLHRA